MGVLKNKLFKFHCLVETRVDYQKQITGTISNTGNQIVIAGNHSQKTGNYLLIAGNQKANIGNHLLKTGNQPLITGCHLSTLGSCLLKTGNYKAVTKNGHTQNSNFQYITNF